MASSVRSCVSAVVTAAGLLAGLPSAATGQLAASFTADVVSGEGPFVVQFQDTSTGATPTAWSWDFGDGQTSTAQHPSHEYAAVATGAAACTS